ncbi:MAG: hypothetical protein KF819_19060 [Labilithrix sp.]|nr:hypothetical protein [Labilithrix sp.]
MALLAGCSAGGDEPVVDEDDLTSLTARQRLLSFEGVVYVDKGASNTKILEAAHKQTQTAFGALLAQDVAARSREMQNVDPASFKKREVVVVDPNVASDAGKPMLEVKYTYNDEAVIPIALARHTNLSLALLARGSQHMIDTVVAACTKNDKEARDEARDGLLWYSFNPAKASCRAAIDKEQRVIDADTSKLTDKRAMVAKSRVERTFLPTAMRLARAATATNATYPEYDKLFSGGVEPGVLTIALVNGRLAHDRTEANKDDGYYEWMDALGVVFETHPEFKLTKIEPAVDVSTVTVEGKRLENLGFKDFIQWKVYGTGFPAGLSAAGKNELQAKIANKLDGKWVTFEKKVKVAIGDAAPNDFTLRLFTMFGADENPEPHRLAVRKADVVIYNGHSYIGYGPLDPDNFRPSSFPGSYQLFWFDSCVSYNYYEKDFFTLKQGGSKTLDIITNGLEAPEYKSGEANGKFIAKFLDGSMPSYQTLLALARDTDSLRVVDGEIDNQYHPSRVKVRLSAP